jgi:hypothetical protein
MATNVGGNKGLALGFAVVAGVFLYGGMTGRSPLLVLKALIQGNPTSPTPGYPISVTTGSTTSASSAPSTTSASSAPDAPADLSQNEATGRLLASNYGWTSTSDWNALFDLWNRESGWNQYATNASSGAYGIPQALPPTKMPAAAQASGGSNVTDQIAWGLEYIDATYGNPVNAWAHETSQGWY